MLFTGALNNLAEAEIDNDSSLLSRERGKAATLMQGVVDRSDIYKRVEISLDALIAKHIGHISAIGREIRRAEAGVETAAEEEGRGRKTEEEYVQESLIRREAREKFRKQEEARKRREDEMEKLRAAEKKKMIELEQLRSADEKRKEEQAREARKEKERQERRALAKQVQREKETERLEVSEKRERSQAGRGNTGQSNSDYIKLKSEDNLRAEDYEAEISRSHSSPQESSHSPESAPAPLLDEKSLEEAALERLLREGRELAAKNGPKPDVERSESLEPPPRKSYLLKTRSPQKPDYPRPKLGYSSIQLPTDSSQTFPKSGHSCARSRSRSPHHSNHYYSLSRSRSHSYSRSDSRSNSHERYSSRHFEEYGAAGWETKVTWKKDNSLQRDYDAKTYKRIPRRDNIHRSRSPIDESRSQYREQKNQHRTHHPQPRSRDTHHDRSRSLSPVMARSSRNHYNGHHDGSYDNHYNHHHHRHQVELSSSRHSSSRDHYHRSNVRDKSPVEIDRYMPGRSSGHVPRRDHNYESGEAKHKGYVEIDRYVPGGDADKERRRGKERGRDRDRDRERDR